MAIQTAGEQKYYDFIEERAKSLRTGMIVWISFLAAALIAVFNSPVVGFVLAAAGAVLAVRNVRQQKELNGKLNGIKDKADFFNQLIAPDTVEIPAYHLLITREYVLSFLSDIYICCFRDMEKVEEEAGQGRERKLFLVAKDGRRYKIAQSAQSDDRDFDKAYETLKKKIRGEDPVS